MGGCSSHQPSFKSRRGSRERRNGRVMILPMGGRCPAGWQRVCRACSEFAYFCADFAQAGEEGGVAPHDALSCSEAYPTASLSRFNCGVPATTLRSPLPTSSPGGADRPHGRKWIPNPLLSQVPVRNRARAAPSASAPGARRNDLKH
jgi:hypothetical protein